MAPDDFGRIFHLIGQAAGRQVVRISSGRWEYGLFGVVSEGSAGVGVRARVLWGPSLEVAKLAGSAATIAAWIEAEHRRLEDAYGDDTTAGRKLAAAYLKAADAALTRVALADLLEAFGGDEILLGYTVGRLRAAGVLKLGLAPANKGTRQRIWVPVFPQGKGAWISLGPGSYIGDLVPMRGTRDNPLPAAGRRSLPASAFALPGRRWLIATAALAESRLRRIMRRFGNPLEWPAVLDTIAARYPQLDDLVAELQARAYLEARTRRPWSMADVRRQLGRPERQPVLYPRGQAERDAQRLVLDPA